MKHTMDKQTMKKEINVLKHIKDIPYDKCATQETCTQSGREKKYYYYY
jgi:hypothetical protein